MIKWAEEKHIANASLVRAMFHLLHRQYDGVGEVSILQFYRQIDSGIGGGKVELCTQDHICFLFCFFVLFCFFLGKRVTKLTVKNYRDSQNLRSHQWGRGVLFCFFLAKPLQIEITIQ